MIGIVLSMDCGLAFDLAVVTDASPVMGTVVSISLLGVEWTFATGERLFFGVTSMVVWILGVSSPSVAWRTLVTEAAMLVVREVVNVGSVSVVFGA